MKKETQKKSLFAVISAFAVGVMKDPIKRAMALKFGKKALTYFSKKKK